VTDLSVMPGGPGAVPARSRERPRAGPRYACALLIVCALHAAVLAALWRGVPASLHPPQLMEVVMLPPAVATTVTPPAAPAPTLPALPPPPRVKPLAPPRASSPEPSLPQAPPAAELPAAAVEEAPPAAAQAPPEVVATPAPAPAPEPVIVPPRLEASYKGNPAPPYPGTSRRLGEAGTVLLRIFVNANGTVGDVRLARSSGFPRLDRSAAETVKRWRLIPARRGDEPFATWYTLPIEFNLEK